MDRHAAAGRVLAGVISIQLIPTSVSLPFGDLIDGISMTTLHYDGSLGQWTSEPANEMEAVP